MQSWVSWVGRRIARPHPLTGPSLVAWVCAFALIVAPQLALASPPTVQPPSGPGTGGSFSGPYTFATYISCSSGVSYGDSYSNGLDGTHTFGFYGSIDGSLLVRIDGGGYQLINSCGDPFTGARTLVASYTVSKNVASATPVPTAAPTPAPTSVPTSAPVAGGGSQGNGGGTTAGSGGSSSGGSSSGVISGGTSALANGNAAERSGKAAKPSAGAQTAATDQTVAPSQTSDPAATSADGGATTATSGNTASPKTSHAEAAAQPQAARPLSRGPGVIVAIWVAVSIVAAAAAVLAWRQTAVRHHLADLWLGLKIIAEPRWFRLRQWLRSRTHGHDEPRRRFVGRHAHTGRLLAHHHTSYGHLGVILLMATVAVSVTSVASRADISGSTNVSLIVQGPPPTTAPSITVPADGDEIPSDTTTVRGECEPGLFVGLYRNTVGAGSVVCPQSGVYAVLISLIDGDNELVAYNADALGQKGPASNAVVVRYVAPPPTPTPRPTVVPTPLVTPRLTPTQSPGAAGTTPPPSTPRPTARPTSPPVVVTPKPVPGAPYYLTTDNLYYQGAMTGQPVSLPVRIAGGRAPYQVSWDWGDGSTSSMFVATLPVTGTYTYDKPGNYRLTITAIDAGGRRSLVTVAIVVSGEAVVTTATTSDGRGQWHGFLDGSLLIAWPVLIMAILVVLSFWLGERRELGHRRRLVAPSRASVPPAFGT